MTARIGRPRVFTKRVGLNIYIEHRDYQALMARAYSRGQSVAALCREALRPYTATLTPEETRDGTHS
jgi:hypothetical protein